jgi:hypothetical protein
MCDGLRGVVAKAAMKLDLILIQETNEKEQLLRRRYSCLHDVLSSFSFHLPISFHAHRVAITSDVYLVVAFPVATCGHRTLCLLFSRSLLSALSRTPDYRLMSPLCTSHCRSKSRSRSPLVPRQHYTNAVVRSPHSIHPAQSNESRVQRCRQQRTLSNR